MAKRGRKPESADVLHLRGTLREDRRRKQRDINPHALEGEPMKPEWLDDEDPIIKTASELWDRKVDEYAWRGQPVRGCESTLAQFCCLEATLIENYWKKGQEPPVTMVNSLRLYAAEFFDSPDSMEKAPSRGKAPDNPFDQHGQPPK